MDDDQNTPSVGPEPPVGTKLADSDGDVWTRRWDELGRLREVQPGDRDCNPDFPPKPEPTQARARVGDTITDGPIPGNVTKVRDREGDEWWRRSDGRWCMDTCPGDCSGEGRGAANYTPLLVLAVDDEPEPEPAPAPAPAPELMEPSVAVSFIDHVCARLAAQPGPTGQLVGFRYRDPEQLVELRTDTHEAFTFVVGLLTATEEPVLTTDGVLVAVGRVVYGGRECRVLVGWRPATTAAGVDL